MTINERQDEIVEEFSQFEDWFDRYSLLIEMGGSLQPLPEGQKTEDKLIEGCQSRVWISARLEDGKVIYEGDSDALIVKGLLSLLISIYSGHEPGEILSAELYSIDRIGMREHLSPTRSNGLASMIKTMLRQALEFSRVN